MEHGKQMHATIMPPMPIIGDVTRLQHVTRMQYTIMHGRHAKHSTHPITSIAIPASWPDSDDELPTGVQDVVVLLEHVHL